MNTVISILLLLDYYDMILPFKLIIVPYGTKPSFHFGIQGILGRYKNSYACQREELGTAHPDNTYHAPASFTFALFIRSCEVFASEEDKIQKRIVYTNFRQILLLPLQS